MLGEEGGEMRGLVVAVGLAAVLAAGCGDQWPTRTPFPLPSGAAAVALPTASPGGARPADGVALCQTALVVPVRITWDRPDGIVLFVNQLGTPLALVWPRGFSARVVGDRLEIVAPDGTVIGRDGDTLDRLGGGGDAICEVNGVFYPPAN